MKYTFNEEKEFDIVAIGRACIDLNAAEYNRPMEETMTFSKYVGGSWQILRSAAPSSD